jgi:transcriptional regulator with XRE-family HTH domain
MDGREGQGGESLGERLKRLRLERGLSQRELSSPGVSYAYISRIEANARQPSVKALRKLAGKLGVSAHYLETGNELREEDARELRLSEAELKLRLEQDAAAAETDFQTLLEEARQDGDAETITRSRLGLGEAAARRGDHREAIAQLEAVLSETEVSPLSHGDVFVTLARAYSALGRPQRGVELLERCLDEVRTRAPDDVAAEVRFASNLSYALSDLGELARAREVVQQTLARAERGIDPYSRVRLYWSLARLALIEGKSRVALRHIHRAIGLLEATEDTRQLARAHLSCGEILIDEGDIPGAAPHLELAEKLLGDKADAADLGWLWSEQARRASRSGDHDEAAALAQRALEILKGTDALKVGRAHAALAEAYAAAGATENAHAEYREAVELLAADERWRDAAATSRAWAQLLRDADRDREAFDVLDRAADYATRAASPGVPARS